MEPKYPDSKKFKEYLKEGLMIFLAVFLGFVAENIREHLSDRTKEKEYMSSLVRDLGQDSAKLGEIMRGLSAIDKGADSLINLLSDSASSPRFDNEAYRLFFRYATSLMIFNATDRTISQLTSSGNFRLIENRPVADSISGYYEKVKDAETQAALDNESANDCIQYAQNIFVFRYGFKPATINKQLITHDATVMIKYVNKLTQMRITQEYYAKAILGELDKDCLDLIRLIHREYDL